jgi:hypothetical protein
MKTVYFSIVRLEQRNYRDNTKYNYSVLSTMRAISSQTLLLFSFHNCIKMRANVIKTVTKSVIYSKLLFRLN